MLQLTKNNIFKQGLLILILFFIAAIFQVLDIHLIANLHYTPIYIAFMMCGSLFRVIDVFDLYKSLNIGKS